MPALSHVRCDADHKVRLGLTRNHPYTASSLLRHSTAPHQGHMLGPAPCRVHPLFDARLLCRDFAGAAAAAALPGRRGALRGGRARRRAADAVHAGPAPSAVDGAVGVEPGRLARCQAWDVPRRRACRVPRPKPSSGSHSSSSLPCAPGTALFMALLLPDMVSADLKMPRSTACTARQAALLQPVVVGKIGSCAVAMSADHCDAGAARHHRSEGAAEGPGRAARAGGRPGRQRRAAGALRQPGACRPVPGGPSPGFQLGAVVRVSSSVMMDLHLATVLEYVRGWCYVV